MGSKPYRNRLHIVSWNANGLFPRLEELKDFICIQEPDIVLIQETRLPINRRSLSIPHYNHYFTFRTDPPTTSTNQQVSFGGTAIYIKNHIPHHPLPSLLTDTIENTLIQINLPSTPGLMIGSAYAKHRSPTPIHVDLVKFQDTYDRFILMGDFNAHHQSWNCKRNNSRGIGIYNFAMDYGTIIATPNAPTHYSHTGSPAIIDFALIHNYSHASCTYTHPTLSSDHLPVSLFLDINSPLPSKPQNKTTNWERFQVELANSPILIPIINNAEDIDAAVEKLTVTVHQALDNATSYSDSTPLTRLPPHIRALIRERNMIRRRWQLYKCSEIKTHLNVLNRRVREKVKEYRNERWTEKISSLSPEDNSIWKFSKTLKNTPHFIPPLNTANGPAYSIQDKLEGLASQFENQFKPNPDIYCENTIAEVEETIHNFLSIRPNHNIDKVYPSEITAIIHDLKTNKSAGHDKITNKMIKCFPINLIIFLTFITNGIFKYHHFPKEWKKAIIAPIYKPGENPSQPSSYRPISLLSCIGKMIEKIIGHKLQIFIDINNIIPPEQFGFRQKHSTAHQHLRVIEAIADGLSRSLSTGAVFFDVSKAFDRVYQDGLIYKMIQLGFPDYLILLIHSYLTDRSFTVRYLKQHSTFRTISASVPQGSTLAPLLFNVFISDIPKTQTTITALFADDTAILCTHKRLNHISTQLQFHIDLLEEWCEKWRIKLNEKKTHFVLFTRREVAAPPIYVNNTHIIPETTAKYLGVTLDKKLIWKTHIENTVKKYNMTKAKIAPLLYSAHLNYKNKILLFKTILRPILLYACPVWNFAAKCHLNKLQIVENNTLRAIRKAPRYLKNDIIRKDFDIKLLYTEIKKQSINFFNNLPTIPNELLFNLDDYDPRHRRSRKRPRAILG